MNILLIPIVIPIIAGLALMALVKVKARFLKGIIALLVSCVTFAYGLKIFKALPAVFEFAGETVLRADNLAGLVHAIIPFFAIITTLYSIGFFEAEKTPSNFYAYLLLTLGSACGSVLANNIVLLVVFWGFMGFTLYLMAYQGDNGSAQAAKKSLVIIGGTDGLMIFGVALLYFATGTLSIDKISVDFSVWLGWAAYVLLLCAGFAKAGAFPFHTWIPEVAKSSPIPMVGFLPASLDKLVGIYFIARISVDMFVMNGIMSNVIMALGSLTIIIAVMMALIQHDLKSLLGYHAVSQVGYMVLGIGTGGLIGIAGGLFHMVNHAIYKTALFFTAGSIEKQAGTTNLDKLGGLVKYMPYSFVVCLAASFAISGVPPFNGFFSKWMIYQGIIEQSKTAVGFASSLWILWLGAAMIGSALTLASLLKVIHAVFLGKESELGSVKESNFMMLLPMGILAVLCLVLGLWAGDFMRLTKIFPLGEYPGLWSPGTAGILILLGLFAGFILYLFGNLKNIRRDSTYIGGEELPIDARITGTEFFKSIENIGFFKKMYELASAKIFDIYELSRKSIIAAGKIMQKVHNGVVHLYISWCLAGFVLVLIYLMVKK